MCICWYCDSVDQMCIFFHYNKLINSHSDRDTGDPATEKISTMTTAISLKGFHQLNTRL